MAQPQTTSTQQTNNTPPADINGAAAPTAKREPKTLTAIEAVQRIGKILDQLAEPRDRKRVIDFVRGGDSEGGE
jgi:hypothetical protein